ncbi:hypothetical protein [Paracoccus sanguinis]|uniref:Uncharacterized protein n=1 Tax=Paracoccus sanguinis TaxID=1545044 RepID=A0A1H3CDY5_9RHOB|nr:hypothetical protein [Paracoccus sanguinis]KGJ18046.1 hypothetical protein IX57_05770 [Paracoccus sanguinis]SDX52295.1 hypothetical protein SAMN05444276_10869 [Paracoccus sanguinis]
MSTITDEDYETHMAQIVAEGFTLDAPGFERLSSWTHMLMHLVNARTNFEWVRDHPVELGEMENSLRQQAFFVAGIMAYCRCFASSGSGVPMLDAKKVYEGSDDGKQIHERLIGLRNSIAAHTDASDIVRLTLAVKEEAERLVIRHLWTMAVPVNEIADFLEAVVHTEHFVTVSLNKYLNRLEKDRGKTIELD